MTVKQFSVHPLREKDLNEWFRLRKLLWDGTSDDDHKSEMLDIIDHVESQLILVAEADGEVVGMRVGCRVDG